MLGYLGRPCRAARIYNVFHTYFVPGVLGLSAFLLHAHDLLPVALIWANHIGVDRLLGYGLKYGDGFGWTHLGLIGAAKRDAVTAGQESRGVRGITAHTTSAAPKPMSTARSTER